MPRRNVASGPVAFALFARLAGHAAGAARALRITMTAAGIPSSAASQPKHGDRVGLAARGSSPSTVRPPATSGAGIRRRTSARASPMAGLPMIAEAFARAIDAAPGWARETRCN